MNKIAGFIFSLLLFCSIFSTATIAGGATVFSDNFSMGLGSWTLGTNTGVNSGGPDIIVTAEEEVAFRQEFDYIENKATFNNSFEISFQVRRTTGSNGNFDFLVEIVEAPDYSGLVRLTYGLDDTFKINIGRAPSTSSGSEVGGDVDDDTGYQKSMERNGTDYIGTVTYTYVQGAMKIAFNHDTLGKIETSWVDTGASFETTKIRIWAMGTPAGGGTRFLDNVSVKAPVTVDGGLLVDPAGNLHLGEGSGTPMHVLGNISCTGTLTEGSSRSLKRNITSLTMDEAKSALKGLEPVKYFYRADPTFDRHNGFIAEDVPELAATNDRKGIRAMDIVAILTRVVQEQQKEIDELKQRLSIVEGEDPVE